MNRVIIRERETGVTIVEAHTSRGENVIIVISTVLISDISNTERKRELTECYVVKVKQD